ncbi:MAG: hypothetical protein Q7T85_09130 [Nitrosomonas sp.]|nr:hypothetical protein [Nitrosomonas sp.]
MILVLGFIFEQFFIFLLARAREQDLDALVRVENVVSDLEPDQA